MNKTVIVNARKFDGGIHRSWECDLIEQAGDLLIFIGVFKNEITHPDLGVIRPDTISYEYYWLNRWYNVFRFHEPNGDFRNFYCNVNSPPKFESGILDYVDLDVDVLISKNFEIEVLDIEEYRINSEKYRYSDEIKKNVKSSVSELIYLAENRQFPFDLSDLLH
jgi:protein associated with RNAse G/E